MRELSAKLTEGEKKNTDNPSVKTYGFASSLYTREPEKAFPYVKEKGDRVSGG